MDLIQKQMQGGAEKIKTTDLGSLYLVEYGVTMKADIDEQSFIDELRVKNGNLTIMLAAAEQQAA